jgi:hypothetical protein
MGQNTFNILDLIKSNQEKFSFDNIVELLIEGFKNELMSENDKNLLKMIFSQNPNQSNLNSFLEKWDIEVAGSAKSLMLAYFMKLHPELVFPEYSAPRLKGLLDFYKFKNIKLFSHFVKICNEFKKNGIDEIMVLKGGAMKHLRKEFPRVMGDIDILVRKEFYEKAGQIAEKMGYDCAWDIHSVDLHPKNSQEGIMDIHKYIYMNTGFEENINNDLFNRAKKVNMHGIDVLIPSNVDMLFIALVNMTRNLTNKTSINGVLFTLFDVQFLINSNPDFDWNIVIKNAQKTKTEVQICFATKFINAIVPNLLPEEIKQNTLFDKKLDEYCILVAYQRMILLDMKQRGHELTIKEAFKNSSNFFEYLKLKPKYFILKQPIFRKNPKLAKTVLKLNEKYEIGA